MRLELNNGVFSVSVEKVDGYNRVRLDGKYGRRLMAAAEIYDMSRGEPAETLKMIMKRYNERGSIMNEDEKRVEEQEDGSSTVLQILAVYIGLMAVLAMLYISALVG